MSVFYLVFYCGYCETANGRWGKGEKTFPGKRAESDEAQIINSSDDVELQMKFFLEISINGAQNFEFFKLSKGMFDDNSFQ